MLGLLLALAVQSAPDEDVARVREYLKTGDAAVAKSLAGRDVAAIERVVRQATRPAPPADGGKSVAHEIPCPVDASTKITYHVAIPEKAGDGAARPLLLTLHGQGGDGAEWLKFRLSELPNRDFYVLAPQAGAAGWGTSLLGYAHATAPLRDALARYPIDPDRVWLDGFSMGANGTWNVGALHADRFAALAPRGGVPHHVLEKQEGGALDVRPFFIRNLRAVPVCWTVGLKDPIKWDAVHKTHNLLNSWGCDVSYKELPEGGHEWYGDETPRIMEWLQRKTRVADPPEVRLVAFERIFARAYWVEPLEFAHRERTITQGAEIRESRTIFEGEVQVTAAVKRDSNSIDVSATGVKRLRLWLNARLVDFSKPVVVRVNRKKAYEGRPDVSVPRLLEEVRRRGDPGFLYPAEVTVKVP